MDFCASGMEEGTQSWVLDNEFEMMARQPADAFWTTEGKTQIPQVPEHRVSEWMAFGWLPTFQKPCPQPS